MAASPAGAFAAFAVAFAAAAADTLLHPLLSRLLDLLQLHLLWLALLLYLLLMRLLLPPLLLHVFLVTCSCCSPAAVAAVGDAILLHPLKFNAGFLLPRLLLQGQF